MPCSGIRGAICPDANETDETDAILAAICRLLERIVSANNVSVDDIGSVIFTATSDPDAPYPARAARQMNWTHVPLLCRQGMAVAGSLRRCIRVLIHWDTNCTGDQIRHVYLGRARALRPDLVRRELTDKEGS